MMRRSLNNRPLRSVLANRKLFQGGGMVGMGNPMAMANMQPAGILASSPNLINSVVGDAVNPQGGPTLSMADGGIAKFHEGGSVHRHPHPVEIGLGAPPEAIVSRAMGEGSQLTEQQRAEDIFRKSNIFRGRLFDPDPVRPWKDYVSPEASPIEQILGGAGGWFDQSISTLTQWNDDAANALMDFGETVVTRGAGTPLEKHEQVRAVNNALRRQPDAPGATSEEVSSLIKDTAENMITEDPHISGDDLFTAIGTAVYDRYELPLAAGIMRGRPLEDRTAEGLPATAEILMAEGPADVVEEVVEPEAPTRDEQIAELKKAEVAVEEVAPDESVDQMIARVSEESPSKVAEPSTNVPPGQTTEEVRESERVAKALDVRDAFNADTSDDQKDARKTLEDYIDEFKSSVPDYEGKSESEKGWDIVKMGMAIAAGESQHAITNIAKGVMATIDNFTSDDKERRAYKRQIGLSAAKYGLQALNKDRATLEALSKEKRSLFGTVFRVKQGQSFEYNGKRYGEDDTVIFQKGDIQDGTAPLNQVDTEDFSIASIKASVKRLEKSLAANLAGIAAVSESPNKFSAERERYIDAVSQVKGNIAIQNLLKEAMVPLAAGEVTGGFNSLKAFGRKIENFFGIELPKEIASAEPERYRFLVNQAIQKNIQALLNEGNRTISDADRRRADTIGGLYADHLLAPSVESREKLERTLIAFSESLDRNSDDMLRRMGGLEDTWDGTFSKSVRPKDYGDILRKQRGSLASTVVATPGAARKVLWTDIIAIDPDTDTMSYKPDWYGAS